MVNTMTSILISEQNLKALSSVYRDSNAIISLVNKPKIKTINNLLALSLGYTGSYNNLVAACRAAPYPFEPSEINYLQLARNLHLQGLTPMCWINQTWFYSKVIDDRRLIGDIVTKTVVATAVVEIYDMLRHNDELQYYILYHIKHNRKPGQEREFLFTTEVNTGVSYARLSALHLAESIDWRGIGLEDCARQLIEYDQVTDSTTEHTLQKQHQNINGAFSMVTSDIIWTLAIQGLSDELLNEYDDTNFFEITNPSAHLMYFEYQDYPEVSAGDVVYKLHPDGLVCSEGGQCYHFVPLPSSKVQELLNLEYRKEPTVFGIFCSALWKEHKSTAFLSLRKAWLRSLQHLRKAH